MGRVNKAAVLIGAIALLLLSAAAVTITSRVTNAGGETSTTQACASPTPDNQADGEQADDAATPDNQADGEQADDAAKPDNQTDGEQADDGCN